MRNEFDISNSEDEIEESDDDYIPSDSEYSSDSSSENSKKIVFRGNITVKKQEDLPKQLVVEEDLEKKKKRKLNETNRLDWKWENKLNSVREFPFLEEAPGINKEVLLKLDKLYEEKKGITEYDVFMLMADEPFWNKIVTETNKSALDFMEELKRPDYKPSRKYKKTPKKPNISEEWFPCTVDELKAFFALIILMGQVRKPAIYQYWSKRKIIRTDIFCQTMPYSRFVNISRFLRFSSKDNSSTEPLNKIHEILDMILNKFNSCYTPNKKISIDESLLKFTGRFKYTHYIPNKSAVRGIKIYKLCESESGYCSNFHIHTTKIERDEDFS